MPPNSTKVEAVSSKWDGNSMTQTDMMEKDTVIMLDDYDRIKGSASKKESHVFSPEQPHGILHRAFSVFLFDESTGSLLLQKRASTKITFPKVWTNTCCSHPLHGMDPSEVDSPDDVKEGTVFGAKRAAIRKLDHELGIPPSQLSLEKFKFLTRLHYWAADTVTHGTKSEWGEHEIDYVLFYCVPTQSSITLTPHPDEVDDIKWVTQSELAEMMARKDLLFSPWFRLIMKKWVVGSGGWWEDLKVTMETDKFCDYSTIYQFDPPSEHLGGNGDATTLFKTDRVKVPDVSVVGDTTKKQGAYGKVKTHSESKISQIMHIDEVWSAIVLLYVKPLKSNLETQNIKDTYNAEDLAFCDDIILKVSRSFASVIRQLHPDLLVDVLIFYLVLRALDTIEDDMVAFSSHEEKIGYLQQFHKTALVDPTWTLDGVGEGDEKRLLQQFDKCHRVYVALKPASRRIISDITRRMATGMAEFVDKDLGQGTKDIEQYNRYCHFVAGIVGEGLTRLFVASGLESPTMEKDIHIAHQMGYFLQKTNIIRDYLEDYVDGRAFWPQSVWKKYSKSGDLGYFANQSEEENREQSRKCLNELVTETLELVPECLTYLSKLTCPEVFRFCAIPQVMAIATLETLYNNIDVFTGVVKIRKGMACKLILNANNIDEVHNSFNTFAKMILNKAKKAQGSDDEKQSYERTIQNCKVICELTDRSYITRRNRNVFYKLFLPFGVIAASTGYKLLSNRGEKDSFLLSSLVFSSFAFGWALQTLNVDHLLPYRTKQLKKISPP